MSFKVSKRNVQDIFELNLTQKGMLFHYLKDVDSNVYNIQLVLEIEGLLNVDLFEKSIFEVVRNNEVLRSVFTWENINRPLQIILKNVSVKLKVQDLSNEGQLNTFLELYFEKDREKRFDLTNKAIRFGMVRLSSDRCLFHITHHHILYDGWSTGILLKELFTIYEALIHNNERIILPKTSYKEVRKSLKSITTYDNGKKYWSDYLKNYSITHLSIQKSNDYSGYNLRKVALSFDADLETFSSTHKVTKASIFYAAYAILLQKYLYTSDIIFGTTVSCRETKKNNSDAVMGNFISTIPLRVSENEDRTLKEIVVSVHQDLIERLSFSNTSYFEIKQVMGLTHSDNLFDSVIAIENYPLDNNIFNLNDDYKVKFKSVYENAAVPLYITVFFDKSLRIEFVYDTKKFPNGVIDRLSKHLQLIIEEILDNPFKKPKDINILSNDDLKDLHAYNDTAVAYPLDRTVIDLFEDQVEKAPDSVAVFNGGESV
ncbi:condensation domain-containing protein, partial [Maribacter sp. 2307UL18-2]|uniref:condensation domain-containing protein n=1 Tax=Maribacter sp. 2307UL18-2 TaxID=3386274 RepID=UPI0039BC2CAD